MIGVNVRSNVREVSKEFARYSKDITEKALVRALNESLDKTTTASNREIRKTYNLKARAVSDAMNKKRARGRNDPQAVLEVRGFRISLYEFSPRERNVKTARGRRRSVSVQVLRAGSRKTVAGGFVATGRGVGIFKREGAGRYPIKFLPSISIPRAFTNQSVLRVAKKVAVEAFNSEYRRQLKVLGMKAQQVR
jgi:hypothetical protein